MIYRPWGRLDWVLSLESQFKWDLVGVIGAEERSLATWKLLSQMGLVRSAQFLQITNTSARERFKTDQRITERLEQFESLSGSLSDISQVDLLTELFNINSIAARFENVGENVVLDISSFPKRFFFSILRKLMRSSLIKNLVLTYCAPASYCPASLYEDIQHWHPIAGFHGSSDQLSIEEWIVSIGFSVDSIRQYLSTNASKARINLLIPFPAPASALRRAWRSVANIESISQSKLANYRVDPLDLSAAFDRIHSIADSEQSQTKSVAFAPFGPKPTSAAVCLYASKREAPVFYAQPTSYHPDYSVGVRGNNPVRAISAYWLKHKGRALY
jgi:hypothetical protein